MGVYMAKKGVNPFAKGPGPQPFKGKDKKCPKCGKEPCVCKKGKGKK